MKLLGVLRALGIESYRVLSVTDADDNLHSPTTPDAQDSSQDVGEA